jgi:hypothetical protein
MYSGITKMYYRKTLGKVFTTPVKIEGTPKHFFPSKLLFIVVHVLPLLKLGVCASRNQVVAR